MKAEAIPVEQMIQLFLHALNVDVPDPDTDLIEEGLLDSLMLVELIVHLEERFGVVVSLDDLELDHFRSLRRVSQFVAASTTTGTPIE
jgi:methoxymalonate biosynthesis acyl carrier protein